MNKLFDVKGRNAIVTGASSGLGVQFSRFLAENGAHVAMFARRADRLNELAGELKSFGVKILPVACDVSDEKSVADAVAQVKKEFGGIDILVNNAGVNEVNAFLDFTSDQWKKVIDINLTGVYNVTRAVAPVMAEKKYGKIVNIASVGALQGMAYQCAYHASKSGVLGLTLALAGDLAPSGITVNAIGPGVFETEMTHDAIASGSAATLQNRTALKRFGKEGELNGAMLYFVSDASSYTTGQIIYVDGGMTSQL